MDWVLTTKKEAQARKPYTCVDCEKEWPAGAYVKRYVFKKDADFATQKICENCEKYYRVKDLTYNGNKQRSGSGVDRD